MPTKNHASLRHRIAIVGVIWLSSACAIEPTVIPEPVETMKPSIGIDAPEKIPGNQAILVSVVAPYGAHTDLQRMRQAIENLPGKFETRIVTPESAEDLTKTLKQTAANIARDSTLIVMSTGFANNEGALTLPDGSHFSYSMLVAALASPIPRFKTLATIIAASQGANWLKETRAFDRSRNFSESIIVTSVPRSFGASGDADDEMQTGILHPAASRMIATLRHALESGKASSLEEALHTMSKTHEQLFGPGPLVEIRR
jgi:hypothetical protein